MVTNIFQHTGILPIILPIPATFPVPGHGDSRHTSRLHLLQGVNKMRKIFLHLTESYRVDVYVQKAREGTDLKTVIPP